MEQSYPLRQPALEASRGERRARHRRARGRAHLRLVRRRSHRGRCDCHASRCDCICAIRLPAVLGIAGVVIGGWPIFKEAAENLLARRMTMELSMSIAIVAAAAISEFFTALIITLFVLVAEVLENMTVARGRRAIRDLMDFLPRTVTVRRAGAVRETSIDELRAGDSILVNPGALIAVDGVVIGGHSFVDQSRITGESLAVEKVAGAYVYAGTINQSGALEVRAERIGRDTSYGKIIEAVERAENSRAPVQRLADRLAGYLVYFALGAAALTFIVTRDMRSTISVVIVAGACGIAAGTPLAILGGVGRAARLGAIIKGGLLSGDAGAGGHCRARQNRHTHVRPHRGTSGASGTRELRSAR